MGIRDIANAAIDAEKSKQEADAKRYWAENARIGERIVHDLLGITGTAIRAHKSDRNVEQGPQWGSGTVVKLEDGVYVVVTHTVYSRKDRWGMHIDMQENLYVKLCDEKGHSAQCADGSTFDSPQIKTLADLGHALAKFDAQPEERREAKERQDRLMIDFRERQAARAAR